MDDLQTVETFLRRHNDFLVTAHLNADGDAIGAVLAFGRLLDRIGKRYRIVLHDPVVDPKFRFLPGFDRIESYRESDADGPPMPSAAVLDTPNTDRAGDAAALVGYDTQILNIDHHESNRSFGHVNYVDCGASSTTEILYRLIRQMEVSLDAEMAACIYTGIMFDTGRFRFSNTSHRAMAVCAEMVALGARPDLIADAVYGHKPFRSVRLLGQALHSLESHLDGRVTSIRLTGGPFDRTDDVDGFVDYAISIQGVEVALFLKEYEPGRFRISLRSNDRVNVSDVAQAFGGGGHAKAAGCRMEGSAEEIRRALLEEVGRHLD